MFIFIIYKKIDITLIVLSVFFKNTSGRNAMAFFFVYCLSHKMERMQRAGQVLVVYLQRE